MRYGKSESVPLVPTSDGDWVRHSDHLKTEGERDKWIDLTGYWREQAENARHRADHVEQLLASEQEKRERAEGERDAQKKAGMEEFHRAEKAEQQLAELKGLVDCQAQDEALWPLTPDIATAYIVQELRRLHAAVEVAAEHASHPAPEPPEEKECELCEGDGEVAKNFGINSPGRPEIVPCPKCQPAPSPAEQIEEAAHRFIVGVEMVRDGLAYFYTQSDPDLPARNLIGCVKNDDLKLGNARRGVPVLPPQPKGRGQG
jgi:hypothetical protein